jgi:hypothetical protein
MKMPHQLIFSKLRKNVVKLHVNSLNNDENEQSDAILQDDGTIVKLLNDLSQL